MSLKKIRRRLSQTFRFSIESSLSELAEHLTIEENNGEVKNNGNSNVMLEYLNQWQNSVVLFGMFSLLGMHHTSTFTKNHRRLSLSHSRIIDVNHRPGKEFHLQRFHGSNLCSLHREWHRFPLNMLHTWNQSNLFEFAS